MKPSNMEKEKKIKFKKTSPNFKAIKNLSLGEKDDKTFSSIITIFYSILNKKTYLLTNHSTEFVILYSIKKDLNLEKEGALFKNNRLIRDVQYFFIENRKKEFLVINSETSTGVFALNPQRLELISKIEGYVDDGKLISLPLFYQETFYLLMTNDSYSGRVYIYNIDHNAELVKTIEKKNSIVRMLSWEKYNKMFIILINTRSKVDRVEVDDPTKIKEINTHDELENRDGFIITINNRDYLHVALEKQFVISIDLMNKYVNKIIKLTEEKIRKIFNWNETYDFILYDKYIKVLDFNEDKAVTNINLLHFGVEKIKDIAHEKYNSINKNNELTCFGKNEKPFCFLL